MSKLSRKEVEDIKLGYDNAGCKDEKETDLWYLSIALLLAWDALEECARNTYCPCCGRLLTAYEANHLPECELAKALPRED